MSHRILLVEDNPQNLYLLHYFLTHQGYQVQQATTVRDGLRRVSEEYPDLILLDVQLSDADGFDFLRNLRSGAAYRTVPVIAVTSCAMPGDRGRLLAAGANAYAEKPIDLHGLLEQIRGLLPMKRGEEGDS